MDIERIFREESGRILATLIGLLGSFPTWLKRRMQEGIRCRPGAVAGAWHACEPARMADLDGSTQSRWTRCAGMPALRVQTRKELQKIAKLEQATGRHADENMRRYGQSSGDRGDDPIGDDRLRLIFTCCHPALALEAQVALTLRTLCGLSTDEIARAFLLPLPTMAQRLVRAKQKIPRCADTLPHPTPSQELSEARLEAVLLVVYLVFNEGYSATSGDTAIRQDLCGEAIRLGRILCSLLPRQTEARALLALMLLHDSRRQARIAENGEPILLEEQNRELWNREQIREGLTLVGTALRDGPAGPYALQAAIAAVHARAQDSLNKQTGARSPRSINFCCGCSLLRSWS